MAYGSIKQSENYCHWEDKGFTINDRKIREVQLSIITDVSCGFCSVGTRWKMGNSISDVLYLLSHLLALSWYILLNVGRSWKLLYTDATLLQNEVDLIRVTLYKKSDQHIPMRWHTANVLDINGEDLTLPLTFLIFQHYRESHGDSYIWQCYTYI